MKIDDIKKAFDSVSANGELKEKVFSRLSIETEDDPITETSYIKLKKGGGSWLTVTALCAAVAMVATVFVLSNVIFEANIIYPPVEITETASGVVDIPVDAAIVSLRVVDEKGIPVKNMRVDYLPVIVNRDDSAWEGWASTSYAIDMDNLEKSGTVPITYGRDEELLIPYGEYYFTVSNAMPNAEYDMLRLEHQFPPLTFLDGSGTSGQPVTVDENTEEIVLVAWGGSLSYGAYPKLGIVLQDANGVPLPDYTVILKPVDGIMHEGYNDKYGGYVLTVTDEDGTAFWRNTPISGEYEVIAYREELHTADEPILEPFIFDGDNTFSYVYNDTIVTDKKVFKMAE